MKGTQMGVDESRRADLLAMIDGFWATQAIGTAAALGIPALLAQEARDDAALAQTTGCHPGALRRLLSALASLGLCVRRGDGRYALTAMGLLLDPDAAGSLHGWARLRHARWGAWGELEASVRDGRSHHHRRFAADDYGELDHDSGLSALFHRAMVDRTRGIAPLVLRAIRFDDGERLVDVGGGSGELLLHILGERPALSGVVYDRAHAGRGAHRRIAAAGIGARCTFVAGSFFDAVPDGADAYLLKSVLHNWDDSRALQILRRCRSAMVPAARLLIVERLAPEDWEASRAHRAVSESDLNMLVARGGRERSAGEFRSLLGEAGFGQTQLLPTGSEFHVIEARPEAIHC